MFYHLFKRKPLHFILNQLIQQLHLTESQKQLLETLLLVNLLLAQGKLLIQLSLQRELLLLVGPNHWHHQLGQQ